MKVSVSYQGRDYGCGTGSTESVVQIIRSIFGSPTDLACRIRFDKPVPGRSWDSASTARVDGARLEMSIADAKALADALLKYVALRESASESDSVDVTLQLREGAVPELNCRSRTAKQVSDETKRRLERIRNGKGKGTGPGES